MHAMTSSISTLAPFVLREKLRLKIHGILWNFFKKSFVLTLWCTGYFFYDVNLQLY